MRAVSPLLGTAFAVVAGLAGCGGGSSSTGPSTLTVTVPVSPIPSGTSVQAVAKIGSSPATSVSWSSSDSRIAAVSSTGLITGAKEGSATIYATSGGLTGQLNVAVVPGAPVSIQIVSGNAQTGPPGSTLHDPLCTAVLDAAGNWIAGIVVTYTVATGGGSVGAPTSPATGTGRIAISGPWTLGPSAGQQSVTATTSVGSVTFTANAQ